MIGRINKNLKKMVCAGIIGLGLDRRGKEMKKLLAVLIVLGLCRAASATTVSLEDEGTTIITSPGSVVVLNFVVDASLIELNVLVNVTGDATITDAISTVDAASYGWDPMFSVDPMFSFDPTGLGTTTAEIRMSNFDGNGPGVVGYVDVYYRSGEVVVSVAEGPYYGIPEQPIPHFSTGVVTIIPEPATILLFGLGVLMVKTRRSRFPSLSHPRWK
jgi:hypothetical protein